MVAVSGFNPVYAVVALSIGLISYAGRFATALLPNLPTISPKNEPEEEAAPEEFTIYRRAELDRITSSLLANAAILVVGEEGSGKSVLASSVVEKLTNDGFLVAFLEPTTPKQMLTEICHEFEISTEDLEGKSLTVEKLKIAIADFIRENTAFIILDDAHYCDPKFRVWLKKLIKQGAPMLILATAPPKSDLFLKLARIELKPLPHIPHLQLSQAVITERKM